MTLAENNPGNLNIAILYICTGKYTIFWEDFFKSSERYFLKNEKKDYYIFTDATDIYAQDKTNVKKIHQENLGWPGNTLFRFRMFKSIIDKLQNYDFIFFFNANIIFLEDITSDILPFDEGLLVVQHPGFYDKNNLQFTYERNSGSLAYIPMGEGNIYVCGGINGGKSQEYIKLINNLDENINKDYQKGIVAIWHDESHLNKYILAHRYKALTPSYAYPQGWNIPFHPKILIKDKNKYGGHDFLREIGKKPTIINKILRLLIKKYFFDIAH